MDLNNKTEDGIQTNNYLVYDDIHWWEFPLTDFSVKLNNRFKNEFFDKVYSERTKSLYFATYINKVSKKYNKNWNFRRQRAILWNYKEDAKFIPAWFVYESAKYLKLDFLDIESNLTMYITFRGKNIVFKPKLPVKVTPEFTAIAIHAMCDGCFTPGENFCYAQKDKKILTRFEKILKGVFGDCNIISTKRKYGTPTLYTPKIFAKIISQYYNIRTYLSSKCEVPDKIMSSSKLHKLSVLSSFLVDEGCTVAGIYFCSSNKRFLRGIITIAESLGYKCNALVTSYPKQNNKLTGNHYKFTLSASSVEKFYLDLKSLFKEFPNLYVGKKFENMEKAIQIRNRGWNQRGKGETKKLILDLLGDGEKTAYELRDGVNISLWTVYHHLQSLIKKGLVKKYKKLKRAYSYCLIDSI